MRDRGPGLGYRRAPMNFSPLRCVALASVACLALALSCVPIARKAECEAADACDLGRDDPFGAFAATDAQFGDVGTCWQSEDTAKACVDECNAFVADELVIALGTPKACAVTADCLEAGLTCRKELCVPVLNVKLIEACGG